MWVSTFYFLCNLNGILQMLISEFVYIYLPISLAQMFVMSTFFITKLWCCIWLYLKLIQLQHCHPIPSIRSLQTVAQKLIKHILTYCRNSFLFLFCVISSRGRQRTPKCTADAHFGAFLYKFIKKLVMLVFIFLNTDACSVCFLRLVLLSKIRSQVV